MAVLCTRYYKPACVAVETGILRHNDNDYMLGQEGGRGEELSIVLASFVYSCIMQCNKLIEHFLCSPYCFSSDRTVNFHLPHDIGHQRRDVRFFRTK